MSFDNWKKIWSEKATDIKKEQSLSIECLIAMDGFDVGGSEYGLKEWLGFVQLVSTLIKLKPQQKILEVGCGSGAFLKCLEQQKVEITGVDYSASLVRIAQENVVGKFVVAEANALPIKEREYDAVLCHSVFQYFPSFKYAEQVLHDMKRVVSAHGRIAILDVNDKDKEQAYIEARKKEVGDAEYNRRYEGYEHLFYSKDWFYEIANSLAMNVCIVDQNISGYINSPFRYNVILSA